MHTTAMLGGRSGMWWKFFFFFSEGIIFPLRPLQSEKRLAKDFLRLRIVSAFTSS